MVSSTSLFRGLITLIAFAAVPQTVALPANSAKRAIGDTVEVFVFDEVYWTLEVIQQTNDPVESYYDDLTDLYDAFDDVLDNLPTTGSDRAGATIFTNDDLTLDVELVTTNGKTIDSYDKQNWKDACSAFLYDSLRDEDEPSRLQVKVLDENSAEIAQFIFIFNPEGVQ